MPVPNQESEFQHHLFCVQWRKVDDPFVDIDDMFYHHCLNVLFYAKVVLTYHFCGQLLWLLLLFYYCYTYNTIVFAGHRKTAYSQKQYHNSEYCISITPTTNTLNYVVQDIIQPHIVQNSILTVSILLLLTGYKLLVASGCM